MFQELVIDLEAIAYIYGAYALTYFANMVLGVCNNCLMDGNKFEFSRIMKSFLKLLVVAVVTASVVVGFNLLQTGAQKYGLEISDTVTNVISIASFLGLFAGGFVAVAQDVYAKIKAMFEIGTELHFDEDDFDDGGIG